MTEQIDRKDLKIQALLQKISSLTSNYENQEADYRVEITLLVNENERLQKELEKRNSAPSKEDDVPSPV